MTSPPPIQPGATVIPGTLFGTAPVPAAFVPMKLSPIFTLESCTETAPAGGFALRARANRVRDRTDRINACVPALLPTSRRGVPRVPN